MICYRDMTFCASDCTKKQCGRFISPEVEEKALNWTRTFVPTADQAIMAIADLSSTCPSYRPPTEDA